MSTDANSKDNKLKFREPGFRDTVVKMKPNNQPEEKSENPLFLKIKETLMNSNPAKWEKYGDELDSDIKLPKAYEKWEIAYCIDLPNGLLTFRCTQPVKSEYFGGGYTVKPDGPKTYITELRPRSWDPRTLIDPFFRSTLEKDKQFKPLADGGVAQELYDLIQKTYINFSSEKMRAINAKIQEVSNNIITLANEREISEWKRDESQEGKVIYTAQLNEVDVELTRAKRLDLFTYTLMLEKDDVSSEVKELNVARDLFTILDEKSKNAALEALQNVLDEAGF